MILVWVSGFVYSWFSGVDMAGILHGVGQLSAVYEMPYPIVNAAQTKQTATYISCVRVWVCVCVSSLRRTPFLVFCLKGTKRKPGHEETGFPK